MNEIKKPLDKNEQNYSLNNSCDSVNIKDEERQQCEVWTRVMGYFRPASEFNIGKKQEFADRKYFNENKTELFMSNSRKNQEKAVA